MRFNPAEVRGELSIQDIVRKQILLTNYSASDPASYQRNVEILKLMLPTHKLQEIEDNLTEYSKVETRYEYRYYCGRRVGTPENPVTFNNPGEYDYDPKKPTFIYSPKKIEVEVVDYDKLYKMILGAFEDCGVSWRIEKTSSDIGGVEPDYKKEPTPYYESEEEEEEDDARVTNSILFLSLRDL